MSNLAFSYFFQGRWEIAVPMVIEAVTISIGTLGKEHPDTEDRIFALADFFTKTSSLEIRKLLV